MRFGSSKNSGVAARTEALMAGFPPDESVVLDAKPTDAAQAVAALHGGSDHQAKTMLATTRESRDWERRDDLVARLGVHAYWSPHWLETWLSAEPTNRDALVVAARRAIVAAWAARSNAHPSQLAPQQVHAFQGMLEAATDRISHAIDAGQDDPIPWICALDQARGQQASAPVVEGYLNRGKAIAPYHLGLHRSALLFYCKAWSGSHDQMFAFADRAVTTAPADAPLQLLPLDACVEFVIDVGTQGAQQLRGQYIDHAIQRASAWLGYHDDDGAQAWRAKNTIAFLLGMMHRFDASYEAYRHVGPYATSSPWEQFGEPRAKFLEFRTACVGIVAANQS